MTLPETGGRLRCPSPLQRPIRPYLVAVTRQRRNHRSSVWREQRTAVTERVGVSAGGDLTHQPAAPRRRQPGLQWRGSSADTGTTRPPARVRGVCVSRPRRQTTIPSPHGPGHPEPVAGQSLREFTRPHQRSSGPAGVAATRAAQPVANPAREADHHLSADAAVSPHPTFSGRSR